MRAKLYRHSLKRLFEMAGYGAIVSATLLFGYSICRAQGSDSRIVQSTTQSTANATAGDDMHGIALTQCKALQHVDFSRVPDAPTQITAAKVVDTKDEPAYCQVQGYVSPQVGFEIRLPVNNWNGKFMETGCAGACGTVMIDWLCPTLLRKGYACISSDMGHEGRLEDGMWAYNNLQAQIDWGYRAPHVTALAGKAITESFYKNAPGKSYFIGCSTGGREGLIEAQRFPWDFDGIVAGAPASDQAGIIMTRLWTALTMRASDGTVILSDSDLRFAHNAVVRACDMNDGVRDGLIGDPRKCGFDPETLACQENKKTQCLSGSQVNALKRIYAGPTTSEGRKIFADGGLMPGSELAFGEYYQSGHFSTFDVDFMRYMAFVPNAGPKWQVSDLNFDEDYKRFAMTQSLYLANNPDLRQFAANGGKLIVYQGWADAGAGGVPPLKIVNYYETVEKAMGGPMATREFFRLFMIPGMGHCGGGDGAGTVDYVNYLEDWVERGQAPDVIVGAHSEQTGATFTRPIYPYPVRTKYKGTGDPKSAESFAPATP